MKRGGYIGNVAHLEHFKSYIMLSSRPCWLAFAYCWGLSRKEGRGTEVPKVALDQWARSLSSRTWGELRADVQK